MGETQDMDGTPRESSTLEIDSNASRSWILEPGTSEVEAIAAVGEIEEAPIEEPGYGHGV
jgi:hypothetical protein